MMLRGVALALILAGPAAASTVSFRAQLTGAAETPRVATGAKGQLTATFDTETRVLSYKVTYSGLTGPATAAQFAGPARAGQTAAPVVSLDDASSPISGHASLTAAQAADLQKGLWYFNVQTAANPEGEIRGQVKRHVDWSGAESAPGSGQDLHEIWRPRSPDGG